MEKTYIITITKTNYVDEEEVIFEYEDEFNDEEMDDHDIAIQLLETALDGCSDND